MATPSIPLIAALPQFSSSGNSPDDVAASSPALQALLSQTGGWQGTQNPNSLAAANPQMGNLLSLMSPPGGLNPQQANQFGPLFALLMSLQGGGR